MRSRPALLVAVLAVVPVGLSACGGDDGTSPSDPSITVTDATVRPLSVITAAQGVALMDADPSIVLIDVRTPEEYQQGHIEGAVNHDVESGAFADAIASLPTDGRYIVYCRSGNRSAAAMREMIDAGFTEVYDMGGLAAWMAAGYPIVTP